ncbi:MAG: hypothetical protein LUB59_01820 [Candidatus Gastranaerophilales bacterium]|nr:hypothetical protein [Candidatus Gastranaerophilales bacterium]
MKISGIRTIMDSGRNAVRNAGNCYATPNAARNTGDGLYMALNNRVSGLKNNSVFKWIKEKAGSVSEFLHSDKLKNFKDNAVKTVKDTFNKFKENGFWKKIKDFCTDKYNKLAQNEKIKNGIDWIKDKYKQISENPKVKGFCQSVRDCFSRNTKKS